jgi:hypothetical protein
MMDIITVVFRDEIPVLKLQAKSIELYCQESQLGRIYVIVNDDRMDVSDLSLDWWGKFRNQVTVVHRTAWGIDYNTNGWLTQQLLKLLATDLCTSKWSMVLDAKTLFVKPVPVIANRPQVGMLDIYPVFDISRQQVNDLFGINLQKQLGPGGVPFILNNNEAQQMIKEIQQLTNKSFADWFQDQGMITEFILYSGYVFWKYKSYNQLYDTQQVSVIPCNLCHSEVASFDRKFREMQTATTVSVHRHAWTQLPSDQQQQYQKFLQERGIR